MNTTLGHRKELIGRFWEERRQSNPHIAYLWDITEELVRLAQVSAEKKREMAQELHNIRIELRDRFHLTIHELEVLTQRYSNNGLNEDIDYSDRQYVVKDILTMEHEVAGKLTRIVDDIAVCYSLEYPINQEQTEDISWNMDK